MNAIKLKIANQLLSKNIPFAIYRFPNKKDIHLAIEKELLPHPVQKFFWMTHFLPAKNSKYVQWAVLMEEYIDDRFLEYITKLKERDIVYQKIENSTTRESYKTQFQNFLKTIKEENIGKAILSRVIVEKKPDDFDALGTFINLIQLYPNTFVHLSSHPISGMWLGASPELLLDKKDRKFSIMSLAGTKKHEEKETPWRKKEIDEHNMVGEHIEEIVKKHGIQILKKEGPYTWHLKKLQHLRTDYALLEEGNIDLMAFINDLHPTPAVGGLPIKKALNCISNHEQYNRKYYCGIIGETDFKKISELYVNLRCMQIGEKSIAIYIGGGLTALSKEEEEWDETKLKSNTMLDSIQSIEK